MSTVWIEASWVMRPSDSVAWIVSVTPVLTPLRRTILALRRNASVSSSERLTGGAGGQGRLATEERNEADDAQASDESTAGNVHGHLASP